MEGDDGAVAGIAHDVAEDVVSVDAVGIVARDDVPHDDAVFVLQEARLVPAQPSVGRAEELALDELVGLLDVREVGAVAVAQALDVVHRVVAHMVSLGLDALEEGGIAGHVVADTEERGVDAVVAEDIEHPRGHLGRRTVVERQVDPFGLRWDAPKGISVEQSAKPAGGMFNQHTRTSPSV